jgi:hypothetical protein
VILVALSCFSVAIQQIETPDLLFKVSCLPQAGPSEASKYCLPFSILLLVIAPKFEKQLRPENWPSNF